MPVPPPDPAGGGGGGGGPPTGAAGGDLAGTYPNPTVGLLKITDAKVAAANKDGLANVPSLRTLGTGAQQALPGDTVISGGISLHDANVGLSAGGGEPLTALGTLLAPVVLSDGLQDRATLALDGTGLTLKDVDGGVRVTIKDDGTGLTIRDSIGNPLVNVSEGLIEFRNADGTYRATLYNDSSGLTLNNSTNDAVANLAEGVNGGTLTLSDETGADPQVLDHDALVSLLTWTNPLLVPLAWNDGTEDRVVIDSAGGGVSLFDAGGNRTKAFDETGIFHTVSDLQRAAIFFGAPTGFPGDDSWTVESLDASGTVRALVGGYMSDTDFYAAQLSVQNAAQQVVAVFTVDAQYGIQAQSDRFNMGQGFLNLQDAGEFKRVEITDDSSGVSLYDSGGIKRLGTSDDTATAAVTLFRDDATKSISWDNAGWRFSPDGINQRAAFLFGTDAGASVDSWELISIDGGAQNRTRVAGELSGGEYQISLEVLDAVGAGLGTISVGDTNGVHLGFVGGGFFDIKASGISMFGAPGLTAPATLTDLASVIAALQLVGIAA